MWTCPGPVLRDNLGSDHWEVIGLPEEPLTSHRAAARAQGPGDNRIQDDSRCRSEVHADEEPNSWTLVALLLVVSLGAWIGRSLILGAPDAARFTGDTKVALDLWAVLVAGLCGFGL